MTTGTLLHIDTGRGTYWLLVMKTRGNTKRAVLEEAQAAGMQLDQVRQVRGRVSVQESVEILTGDLNGV